MSVGTFENPMLDPADEDNAGYVPMEVPEFDETPWTALEAHPIGWKSPEAKAKRATKRAQNHLDHPKWFKRGITSKDLDYINFLVQYRFAKAQHLAHLHGTTTHTAYKRLKGLEEYGYVESRGLHDTANIWIPTPKALKRSDYFATHRAKRPSEISWAAMPHTFATAYVAASVQGGKNNALNRPGGLEGWTTHSGYTVERAHTLKTGTPPARFFLDLGPKTPTGIARRKLPDLVLANRNGLNVAVEVELHYKGKKTTEPLFRLYGRQEVFDVVLYVVPDKTDRSQMTNLLDAQPDFVKKKVRVLPLYYPNADGELVEWCDDSAFLYRK